MVVESDNGYIPENKDIQGFTDFGDDLLSIVSDPEKARLYEGVYNGDRNTLFRAFDRNLKMEGLTPDEAYAIFLGPVSDPHTRNLNMILVGQVFEQSAFRYLKQFLQAKRQLLLNPHSTSAVFKGWRDDYSLYNRERIGTIPDGIVFERSGASGLVLGFTEYSANPKREGKVSQSDKLHLLIEDLLDGKGGQPFLDQLAAQNVFACNSFKFAHDRFNIFYVLPSARTLPQRQTTERTRIYPIPFTHTEVLAVTKQLAGVYFDARTGQKENRYGLFLRGNSGE